MASPSAGYGGAAEEHYMQYHVPQQSRREKLRYLQDETPPYLFIHPSSPPQLHHAAAAAALPSSSSSQNPSGYGFCAAPPGPTQHQQQHHQQLFAHHQISGQQPFSLSLSPSAHTPPRHHHHQQQQQQQQVMVAAASDVGPGPLGPFTGYAEILNRSRFLEPARELLEEVCNVGVDLQYCPDPAAAAAEGMMTGGGAADGEVAVIPGGVEGQQQQQWKKTRLISMLDEVYRRYKLYYQQVQAVIASFESVPGLRSAAPYASVALKIMSKHFRSLKNAISHQLHHINKAIGKEGVSEEENSSFGLISRSANQYGTIRQPHVWRPQRGLPDRAVAVLRAWLFEHFLHPYPTDADKQMLAKQTGLTRNQVSNWFINARVRLWKPMVEEIHSLEMRQQNKDGADKINHATDKQAQLPSSSTTASSNNPPFPTITQNNQNHYSKRAHDELTQIPNHMHEPNFNFVYNGFPSHHDIGVGGGVDVKGNGGVSLTLGLHQNNGICLAEPIPLNVVRRFGLDLEECNDPYVIGSFGGQDRHFEKEIGGHFLHDFVG